jgi:hypothetical protein
VIYEVSTFSFFFFFPPFLQFSSLSFFLFLFFFFLFFIFFLFSFSSLSSFFYFIITFSSFFRHTGSDEQIEEANKWQEDGKLGCFSLTEKFAGKTVISSFKKMFFYSTG